MVVWYAVQVCTGREELTCSLIEQRVDKTILKECFVPRYEIMKKIRGEWTKCTVPSFPGYLIAVTDNVELLASQLREVPLFAKLLSVDGKYLPLEEKEIDFISVFTEEDTRIIKMSTGIIEGDQIIIFKGPLVGHAGWITKINRHKRIAYLKVQMFGRSVTTKVGLSVVKKLP